MVVSCNLFAYSIMYMWSSSMIKRLVVLGLIPSLIVTIDQMWAEMYRLHLPQKSGDVFAGLVSIMLVMALRLHESS